MWAALLGLMLVCSTMVRPGTRAADASATRVEWISRTTRSRSRKTFT